MLCNNDIFSVILICLILLVVSSALYLQRYHYKKKLLSLSKIHLIEKESSQNKIETLSFEIESLNNKYDRNLHELREIKAKLIYSEKMTELGKLIAGVAHELNNPVSAIKASSEIISEHINTELNHIQNIKKLYQDLGEKEILLLKNLITKTNSLSFTMSYKERKEKIKKLKTIFEENNFQYETDELEKYLDVGLDSPTQDDLFILSNKNPEIKQYILSKRNLGQHLSIIDIAVERAANLLLALKKFSRNTPNKDEKYFNLIDNIETVLAIYHYQMKGKISLSKTYLADAVLFGCPEELFQVWTNLLLNAFQAMNYSGNIILHLQKSSSNTVELKIIDNGPGIPVEIGDKIFDSDISTKKIGEGLGMGLRLSKSIIENHKGNILLFSEPGRTEFRITLPVAHYLDFVI